MSDDLDGPGPGPANRLLTVIAFTLGCALIFGFLWINSGGRLPVVSRTGYTVSANLPRVANTVYFGDVMVAGVKVGKVIDVQEHGDHASVEMELDDSVAPLHEGATLRVRAKSLVEESFLEITDGTGPELASGTRLPDDAAQEVVQLADVLNSLDPATRTAIRQSVRSLGVATDGTDPAIAAAVRGLGDLGRHGLTVTDALAAQSEDLRDLARNATRVLAAMDRRQGQLSALVADGRRVFEATAGQQQEVRDVVRSLAPVLTTAQSSSDDLERLAGALTPVMTNLEAAAPDLTAALEQLPATTADLRAAMPALIGVLDRAPATLTELPGLADDITALLPDAADVLSDLNPMLAYMEPYGIDVGAFFANFSQTIALGDVNGKAFRVMPFLNDQSYKGIPLTTNLGPLDRYNPIPAPGEIADPGPYGDRDYPRIERE